MRTRRRLALLLASAAALGVGLIAFPASAAAAAAGGADLYAQGLDGQRFLRQGHGHGDRRVAWRGVREHPPGHSRSLGLLSGESGNHEGDHSLRRRRRAQPGAVPGPVTAAQLAARPSPRRMTQCGPGPGGSNTLSVATRQRQRGRRPRWSRGSTPARWSSRGPTTTRWMLYARAPMAIRRASATTRRPTPRAHDDGALHGHASRSCPRRRRTGRRSRFPNTDAADSGPGRLLRDHPARGRRPGEVPSRGIPAQGPGGLRLHRPPTDRHDLAAVRRHDGSVPRSGTEFLGSKVGSRT